MTTLVAPTAPQFNKVNYARDPRQLRKGEHEDGQSLGQWKKWQTQFNKGYDPTLMGGAHYVSCGSPGTGYPFLGVIDLDIITKQKLEQDKKGKYSALPLATREKIMAGGPLSPVVDLLDSFLAYFQLPSTYVVETGSGGFHLYYWCQGALGALINSSTGEENGRYWEHLAVDFRGQGGLIYGVGTQWADSEHPYRPYRETEGMVADCEGWRVLWAIGKARMGVCGVDLGEFLGGKVDLHKLGIDSRHEFIVWREAMYLLKTWGYTMDEVRQHYTALPCYNKGKTESETKALWNKEADPKRVHAKPYGLSGTPQPIPTAGSQTSTAAATAATATATTATTATKKKERKPREPKGAFAYVSHEKYDKKWGFWYRSYTKVGEVLVPTEECFIPSPRFIGRGRYNDNYYFLCRDPRGFYVKDLAWIHRNLHDNGAPTTTITQRIKNWLVTTDELRRVKMVFGYGFKQDTLDKVYLPPKFMAGSVKGFGDILIASFHVGTHEENTEAVASYKQVLDAARHGVGDKLAFVTAAFAMASLARERLCTVADVFPILHLIGVGDTGKSSLVGYLGNVAHLPMANVVENAETIGSAAIFSQLSAAGFFLMGVDEGRNPDWFRKTLSQILQSATGPTSRKRMTPEGDKRDDLPVIRALAILSNHDIKTLNDPETQTRVIRGEVDILSNNLEEWRSAVTRFNACPGSILSYCHEHCEDHTLPNLNELVSLAYNRVKEIASRYGVFQSRNYRKVIAIFFGLFFLNKVLDYPLPPDLFDEMFLYCVESTSGNLRPTAQVILSALSTLRNRYDAWMEDHALMSKIENERDGSKYILEGDGGEGQGGRGQSPEEKLSVLRQRMLGYEEKGMCMNYLNSAGEECYAVHAGIIPYIKKEMKDVPCTLESTRDFRAIFKEIGVVLEPTGKTQVQVRIPWMQGPDEYAKRVTCVLVPVRLRVMLRPPKPMPVDVLPDEIPVTEIDGEENKNEEVTK